MDHRTLPLAVALGAAVILGGCTASTSSTADAGSSGKDPESATFEFLEAVRIGDDQKAASMLTAMARQRTAEKQMVVAPPGSPTASFAVREVMLVDEGAHVATDWTDADADGHMHTDRIVWILREQPEGWRIAGMATKVFDDRPPVVLNFEDPEDMLRQQQWAEEEIARRDAQQAPGDSTAKPSSVR